MLESVYVDGLKSLKDMKLTLNAGLNVLIGPNGSGKSNILTAFELISSLNQLDFLNSVGKIGSTDISELFDIKKNGKRIKIVLEGANNSQTSENNNKQYSFNYIYECEIEFNSFSKNKIYFLSQSLKLFEYANNKKIEIFYIKYENNEITINSLNDTFVKKFNRDMNYFHTKESIIEFFTKNYGNGNNALKFRSMVYEFSLYFELLREIVDEWEVSHVFNIDPQKVRENIDKKVRPVLEKYGSGLSSVLLEIWNSRNDGESVSKIEELTHLNCKDVYNHIIACLKQLSIEYTDIKLEYKDEYKKIECNILTKNDEVMPLALMSDGTLKWLSLVTALLTAKKMFILEEPENYMNASMQSQFIDLMRDSVEDRGNFGLLSTHSESIINLLDPKEIIITFYRDGCTRVGRIEDIELLNGILEESGDGLAWYVVTGALDPDSNGRILPIEEK